MIKKIINKVNLWSDRSRNSGRMAVRDRYVDIKRLLSTDSPIIIDGGANTGSSTDRFLSQYNSPHIHAFEPIPELVEMLKKRYSSDNKVTIHGVALGGEDKNVKFNVTNYLASSSIFDPSTLNKKIHGEKMDIRQVIDVQQVRLEGLIADLGTIDLLKLDLQGCELEALKGCGSQLNNVKIITTEIEFVPLYDRQPLFGDIDVFIRTHGFQLFNLYELFTHPNGQLTAGDAVYLNNSFFK